MAWLLSLVPALAAAAVVGLRRRPRLLGPVAVGGVLLLLPLAGWLAATEADAGWRWSDVIGLQLRVVGFSRVMVVLVPAIAAPIVAYAAATEPQGRTRLLALMVAFVAAMELLVTAADFVTLLVGWELVGAVSWALIGHGWAERANTESAAQAFVTTRVGDLGLYLAAGMAFAASGSFAFDRLPDAAGQAELGVIAFGVLVAAAAKSAQLPFAPWLFSAMAGPTPVLLHSATLVAAGAYLLVRLAPAFEPVGWFGPAAVAVGLTTALAGGAVAALHDHAKRVLAGSTSAQYGLMFLAVGAGSTAAAGAQLVTHAAFKSLLFLGAGIAIHAVGSSELATMRLGHGLRRVAWLSAVGAAALAALPPLGGGWSKEEILGAAGEWSSWLAGAVLVAGFVTAGYAARYQALAFGPGSPPRALHRPGGVEVGAVATLAAITAGLSVLWLPWSEEVVESATGGELAGTTPLEVGLSLLLTIVAVLVVGVLWRTDRLVTLGLPEPARQAVAAWLGLPVAARRLVVEPVLSLAMALRRFDDRVIDAGVRAAAALAALASRLLSRRAEWTIDGVVRTVAGATLRAAGLSRIADERAIDGLLVEGTASGVGRVGRLSRRLQTGLSHHYYVVVAAGTAVIMLVLALAR